MKFGEKLKALRLERNLSQKALADLSGITVRTIQNYETTDMLPKRRDTYDMLARALGVDVVELLNEDEEFILNAGEQYGSRGERQARAILDLVCWWRSFRRGHGRLQPGAAGSLLGSEGHQPEVHAQEVQEAQGRVAGTTAERCGEKSDRG